MVPGAPSWMPSAARRLSRAASMAGMVMGLLWVKARSCGIAAASHSSRIAAMAASAGLPATMRVSRKTGIAP